MKSLIAIVGVSGGVCFLTMGLPLLAAVGLGAFFGYLSWGLVGLLAALAAGIGLGLYSFIARKRGRLLWRLATQSGRPQVKEKAS